MNFGQLFKATAMYKAFFAEDKYDRSPLKKNEL